MTFATKNFDIPKIMSTFAKQKSKKGHYEEILQLYGSCPRGDAYTHADIVQ